MKKSYKWLFLVFLLMFFCVNIDGVKAATTNCPDNIQEIYTDAYSCDYLAETKVSQFMVLKEGNYSFGFNVKTLQYNNNNYCYIVTNQRLTFKDKGVDSLLVSDDSFDYGDAYFRLIEQSLPDDASSIFAKMKNGTCPTLHAQVPVFNKQIVNCEISSHKIIGVSYHSSSGISNLVFNNMQGSNLQPVNRNDIEKGIDDATLTNEEVRQRIINAANKEEILNIILGEGNASCVGVLSDEVADFLKKLFLILCVVGIILCIVFTVFDFINSISSNEDDSLSKHFKKLKNRIILIIVLLLLPVLINWFIDFTNKNLYYDENSKITFGKVSDCLEQSSETVDQSNFSAGAARREALYK